MTLTYLISSERLKEYSYIQDNVDQKVIEPTIIAAQDLYILPLLGTALFDAFKTKLAADNLLTSDPNYKELLEAYIYPCLICYIQAEFLIYNTYKFANKAVLSKTSDNSQPLSINDIYKIRDDLKNKAEVYAAKIERYLCANSALFPEYVTQTRTDAIYPAGGEYDCGIYLG